MAQKLQQQLNEVGSKLENLPTTKDGLIKLLKQAAASLSDLDQSPPKAVLDSLQPLLDAIVKPELLKYQDKEVKLLVATCICEITRITAPEAPYSDSVLKDIFHLIVSTFSGLRDTQSPSFGRRVIILETLARYRSCIVMLDLECDDLINEMFTTFFAVASNEHSESVFTSMQTIMVVLLEESEEVKEELLLVILSALGQDKKDMGEAARRLAMNVIGQCAGQLEAGIKQFLVSSMSGDSRPLNSQIDYHEIIYDIYRCAPQVLSGVVPYLTGELLTDKIDIRLKAVGLVGDLFALPGSTISETFQPIFLEFLKRLTDRVVEVRMSVLEHVKLCLLSDPFRVEAPQIISALCDRLLDYDESIRKQVVAVICDVACCALSAISVETVKLVAERLRDKSHLVKKYSMERLSEIYRTYCLKHSDKSDEYDWIPGKILRCFYDKDFRSDTVEHILCTSLFPAQLSVKDRVANWIRLFSGFDRVEVKALQKILEHKQRLQLEMQKYLSLRQSCQENEAPEVQKRAVLCFRIMSRCFTDPTKAEENFQILDQLKDANIWKILATLLDTNTSSLQASSSRDDLLKILGEKHRLYEFLSTLSLKCSYILFNKDYVKDFLLETNIQKSAGNRQLTESCMNILVILASFSPLLLSGTEDSLVHFLEDDYEVIKEGALHVLAKAGGSIRERLGESSSSLDLILERICLEGSRRQAKYAVHALAAITKDDGLMSLSVLYKKLVDMLKEKTHLPAVLQSLGCIAQTAMPVFETRESDVEDFIKRIIFECSPKTEDKEKESWDDISEVCSLKIFGIKALVKSYLPVKDAHLRLGIDDLIRVLHNFLSFGEISKEIESSSVDKAHLRLASAKAVLRLSRHWEHKITVELFYLTLRTLEGGFPEVKKIFLDKVHQYIKDRLLDPKYAYAFLLDLESLHSNPEEERRNLSDIIQMCHQGKARQLSLQADPSSSGAYPEYILTYLVHSLAHHSSCPNVDECKDVKAFEPIYRRLHLFLTLLAHGNEEVKGEVSLTKEETISIVSIFRSIKQSEDVVDTKKSKNSHGICDLGLSIVKRLTQKQDDLPASVTYVSLPPVLYKPQEKKEGSDIQVTEGQTWLADESVLVHFESIKLEANKSVPSEIVEDEALMDSETDGNEIPLSKMLKLLKAKGAKAKKALKNGSLPTEDKNENNVDILGMVREINIDNIGASSKFDSNNGHTHSSGKNKTYQKHKRKGASSESTSVPVSKRPRSSSTQSPYKVSIPTSSPKSSRNSIANNRSLEGVSAFDSIQADDDLNGSDAEMSVPEGLTGPIKSDLVVQSNQKKGTSSGWSHIPSEDFGDKVDIDLKPKKEHDADGIIDDDSPKMGSAKKRKRRRVSGLSKCTSKKGESHTTDLIGCRIKVWWPMDKAFYEGVVKSYDHQKQKHVVLYNDGDVEVIRLDKERWELIDSGRKPTKRVKSSKNLRPKGGSSEPKTKSRVGSKQTKKSIEISPTSKVTGKRTPRKSSKQGQKWAPERKSPELMEAGRNETSESSDPEAPTFTKVNTLDTEEESSDEEDKNIAGRDVSDNDEKSVSEGKQVDDGGSLAGEDESDRDEKSVSEDKQVEDRKNLAGEDESYGDEKSAPEGKLLEDSESSSTDTEDQKEELDSSSNKQADNVGNHCPNASESDGEERSELEGNQSPNVSKENSTLIADEEDKSDASGNETDDGDTNPIGPSTSDRKSSGSDDSGDAEFSDDEPLSVWKSRVKSAEGK